MPVQRGALLSHEQRRQRCGRHDAHGPARRGTERDGTPCNGARLISGVRRKVLLKRKPLLLVREELPFAAHRAEALQSHTQQ